MNRLRRELLELGRIEQFALQSTVIHRLDARAKVLTTLVFLLCVVSFPKYSVVPMLPFLLFPVAIAGLGRLPLRWLAARLAAAAPFALMVGLANPLLDPVPVPLLEGVSIAGGWLSLASIGLRVLLTLAAGLLLIATTGMPGICGALRQLGLPEVFVTQLQLLYRYGFLLGEEALRTQQARDLRSFGRRGSGLAVSGPLLGALLLRTVARAGRIHDAMRLRGFPAAVPPRRRSRFGGRDAAFLLGSCTAFLVLRQVDGPELLGRLLLGVAP